MLGRFLPGRLCRPMARSAMQKSNAQRCFRNWSAANSGQWYRRPTSVAVGCNARLPFSPSFFVDKNLPPRIFKSIPCSGRGNGRPPECPSFCDQKEAKSPTVSMRWTPTRAAAFCLSSYAAKSCEARCKKQRAALVPLFPGRAQRPIDGARSLAPLRCGHLTTAYSPAGAGEQGR